MSANDLDVLLIEDNQGDARLIEEMLRDAEGLLQRVDVTAEAGGEADVDGDEGASTAVSGQAQLQVYHERRLSAGVDRLAELDVDVVLLDLGLPDSTGLETLEAVLEVTEFLPVVVLTGLADEEVGLDAIQHGAQDYLVKGEVTSDLLVRSLYHAIERARQDRERARRREQLEALNRLNRIGQDVTHAVITTATREELERTVCERLGASDAYRAAWIGDVNHGTNRITPRVAAGVHDEDVGEIPLPDREANSGDGGGDDRDSSDPGEGPASRAIRTHEVEVLRNVRTEPEGAPWREAALDSEAESIAAVPIVYEEFLYGVLTIRAASPRAFSPPEIEILSRLGDVIGHAITALERKDALVNRTALELDFQAEGVFDELVDLSTEHGGRIVCDSLIRSDGALLAYGQVSEIPREEFREAAQRAGEIDEVRLLTDEREEYEFEVTTEAASVLTDAIATHGGTIESARIADGEFRFVVEFPPGRDTRQLIELVEANCAGASPRAQRRVQRSDREVVNARSILEERLTEKQQTALQTAYFAGFFEWPRESTGQEVADRLGISPATFTQHLRTAEREIFDSFFEEESDDR